MANDDVHTKLEKDKPPRVHIKYEVDTDGAIEQRELPLMVGVIGDFSGMPETKLPALKHRKFVEIDGDNFDKVMERTAPRLAFKAPNTLEKDGTDWQVTLNFSSMDDFEPANVARQIGPLRELLEARQRLSDLRNKMYSSEELESALFEILNNTEQLKVLQQEAKTNRPEPTQPDTKTTEE